MENGSSKTALWDLICEEFQELRGLKSKDKAKVKPEELPSPKTCHPVEYLDNYILPILLNGIEAMLKEAEQEQCFRYKCCSFNALDFLTEYLYNHNPNYPGRAFTPLRCVPFAQKWLLEHPRPALPKWILLSRDAAASRIQALVKGFLLRRNPDVQEMRDFWKKIHNEKREDTQVQDVSVDEK